MLLRKVRCFRLGRRRVRVWRRILRGRSTSYRRLEHDGSPAIRLVRWVRSLRQKICSASVGGDEGLKRLLLKGEERPPPKGHLVVYVGGGEKEDEPPQRYLVPVFYFNHPLFGELLREAEEEFGFHHPRGITIPCPAWRFERVRTRIAAGCAVVPRKSGCRMFWFL